MANDIIASAQAAAQTPANGAPAEQTEAPQSAAQRRVAELNQTGAARIYSRDPAKQTPAMVELRAALAASETDEDRAARAEQTVEERRAQFGVTPATLPKASAVA